MHIILTPQAGRPPLTLVRSGDTLTGNGKALDMSILKDGETLAQEDAGCDWLASDVARIDGVLHLTVILPCGPTAPEETRFPVPIDVTGNGPIDLPPYDAMG